MKAMATPSGQEESEEAQAILRPRMDILRRMSWEELADFGEQTEHVVSPSGRRFRVVVGAFWDMAEWESGMELYAKAYGERGLRRRFPYQLCESRGGPGDPVPARPGAQVRTARGRRVLAWLAAAVLLVMLMIGIGTIGVYIAGNGTFAGLLSGGLTAVVAVVGLRMLKPSVRAHAASDQPSPEPSFERELARMLEHVAPSRLDSGRSTLIGNVVVLAHETRPDWDIHVTVDSESIIVGAAGMHEHFDPPPAGAETDRPWTTEAVDFIAELLRGEIVVQRTYRGRFLVRIEHGRTDQIDESSSYTTTVLLTPALLLPFMRRRVECERPSFQDES